MKIVRKQQRITTIRYAIEFEREDRPGAGFSFPCTSDGELLWHEMSEAARENYRRCVHGEVAVGPGQVVRHVTDTTEPAVGQCACGRRVILDAFTNTCACGRDYNFAGVLLAPRSQWGEETGETWSECL